jgi:hypothetical protein
MAELSIAYKSVPYPVSEIPAYRPEVGTPVYTARLKALRQRMERSAIDALIIYADREHAANFSYLTGFGPRFEEALLLIFPSGNPLAILGNENLSMPDFGPVQLERAHFPTFSLLNQPRQNVKSLRAILRQYGLSKGMTVGTVGWKYYAEQDGCPTDAIELPAFIVQAIQDVTRNQVRNATALLMSPHDGLRTHLEAEQIAANEFAACVVARSILNLMKRIEVGCSEFELAAEYNSLGLPLVCHPMVSLGEKARFGLTSPSNRRAKLGDFVTAAFGVEGALACRAAYIAMDEHDLAADCRDWLERIAMRYFATAVQWYQTVGVGVAGHEVYALVQRIFPSAEFGWSLNPGHYIAEDEWVSSPFYENSDIKLHSGNQIQFDLIPAPKPPYFGANMEDGVALADEQLRAELQERYPEVWQRFERRRNYINDVIGINLRPDVLPMSDLVGYYVPFLLNKETSLVVA